MSTKIARTSFCSERDGHDVEAGQRGRAKATTDAAAATAAGITADPDTGPPVSPDISVCAFVLLFSGPEPAPPCPIIEASRLS